MKNWKHSAGEKSAANIPCVESKVDSGHETELRGKPETATATTTIKSRTNRSSRQNQNFRNNVVKQWNLRKVKIEKIELESKKKKTNCSKCYDSIRVKVKGSFEDKVQLNCQIELLESSEPGV